MCEERIENVNAFKKAKDESKFSRMFCVSRALCFLLLLLMIPVRSFAKPQIITAENGYTYCLPLEGEFWVTSAIFRKYDTERQPYYPWKEQGYFLGKQAHPGLDLQTKNNPKKGDLQDVYSITGGTIIYSNHYDNLVNDCITIKGDDGLIYEYAHLSSRKVQLGETVKTGDPIGVSGYYGSWGNAPHLHLQIADPNQTENYEFYKSVHIKSGNKLYDLCSNSAFFSEGKYPGSGQYRTMIDPETFFYLKGLIQKTTWSEHYPAIQDDPTDGSTPAFAWGKIQVNSVTTTGVSLSFSCRMTNIDRQKIQEIGIIIEESSGKKVFGMCLDQSVLAYTRTAFSGHNVMINSNDLMESEESKEYRYYLYVKYNNIVYRSDDDPYGHTKYTHFMTLPSSEYTLYGTKVFKATKNDVPVRNGHDSWSTVIGEISSGKALKIINSTMNHTGSLWYFVEYDGQYGWVYDGNGILANVVPDNQPEFTWDIVRVNSISKTGVTLYYKCTTKNVIKTQISSIKLFINGKQVWADTQLPTDNTAASFWDTVSSSKFSYSFLQGRRYTYYFEVTYKGKKYFSDGGKGFDSFMIPTVNRSGGKEATLKVTNPVFWRGPDSDSKRSTASVSKNTSVSIIGATYNDANNLWYFVKAGNEYAWIFSGNGIYQNNGYTTLKSVNSTLARAPIMDQYASKRKRYESFQGTSANILREVNDEQGQVWYEVTTSSGNGWVWYEYFNEQGTTRVSSSSTTNNRASTQNRDIAYAQDYVTATSLSGVLDELIQKTNQFINAIKSNVLDRMFGGYVVTLPMDTSAIEQQMTCDHGCSTSYAGYYTVSGTVGNLAISSIHAASDSAGAQQLGNIPEGTTVYISMATGYNGKGKSSGHYGHVTYNGISGYCAMNCLVKKKVIERIVLDKTTIDKTIDDSSLEIIHATIYPKEAEGQHLIWASDNPSVAEVSNGVVSIKNTGIATISCTASGNQSVKAICNIFVTKKTVPVTHISLNKNFITLQANAPDSVQLFADVVPTEATDCSVTWTSSDYSVASVSDSGLVTAGQSGTATITCTSNSNTEVAATCIVTVTQPVTDIILNETDIARNVCEGTVCLEATVVPSNATNKSVMWTSDNPSVASVSAFGEVIIGQKGIATITCISVSNPQITATCSVRVKQPVTSVKLGKNHISGVATVTPWEQIACTVLPADADDKSVVWSSSNEQVATVTTNGTVSIIGAGSAVIICKSVSNPEIYDTCTVAIKPLASTLTLNKEKIVCYKGDTTIYQLSSTIEPADANQAVKWESTDPDIASVSQSGAVKIGRAGIAFIYCTSVQNDAAWAICAVEVKQPMESVALNQDEIVCFTSDGDFVQLVAYPQPAFVPNQTMIWSSSDTDVASISETGVVTFGQAGTATITCRSDYYPDVSTTCAVTVKQGIVSIALNETELELYSDENPNIQLEATIYPSDSEDNEIAWSSSNPYVAYVTQNGLFGVGEPGTATITCYSVRKPEIKATCDVTVKQHVEEIMVIGETQNMLPGEVQQLSAECYPYYATDTSVAWHNEDPAVATVDETGKVTAVKYGTAIIKACAGDGSGVEGSLKVTVEKELSLQTEMVVDSVYTQGTDIVTLGYVRLTEASARRMAASGYELTWSLQKQDSHDDVGMSVSNTTAVDRGEACDTTFVTLAGSEFHAGGDKTYVVTCVAGPYTESAELTVHVEDTAFAERIALDPSTIRTKVDEPALIPEQPASADGKPVPAGLTISGIDGDHYFYEHVSMWDDADGVRIAFDQSGVYTATVSYEAANISYTVPVSFYVADEDGIVHIRVEDIVISEHYKEMVEGEQLQLTAVVSPADAYDASVTWTSSDADVAAVDQNGVVTAKKAGYAAIICTANDGSGNSDMCVVSVESFLYIDEAELEYTVYTGGEAHYDLGIVNLSYASEKRLMDAGLNVSWSLTREQGNATQIALEEFQSLNEDGISVSGNRIKLIRVNGAGDDIYRLTCKAGKYSRSCVIRIHAVDAGLPDTLQLKQTTYHGITNEYIVIDTSYTCDPDTSALPEGTRIDVDGGRALKNALSVWYSFTEPEKLIFSKAGTYTADVIFTGDNYRYTCPITIIVEDEDGNVPDNITDVVVTPDYVSLMTDEEAELSIQVVPSSAAYGEVTWSSSDSSVATVSSTGKVSAISAGYAYISAFIPECDEAGGCLVNVEAGLTLDSNEIERTIYLDGITRAQLDTVMLTEASSLRMEEEPEWTLTRVSGNNLTLRAEPYQTVNEDGDTMYGCNIQLYSVSRTGDTVYELACSNGNETVYTTIVVHAVSRSEEMPASITLAQTVFTAEVNELIVMTPEVVCYPEETKLPDGIRVSIEGEKLFKAHVNAEDCFVSQSMATVSFDKAGLFEANLIYAYSNLRYVVPVTFRIRDNNGLVPILSTDLSLSHQSMWLVPGETAEVSAIFTPGNADDQHVTWESTDTHVVTVDQNGHVTAVGTGIAGIKCKPHDETLNTAVCMIYVEEYLTVETGKEYTKLYRQGEQVNSFTAAWLSEGTIKRLKEQGITPEWTLTRVEGEHADVVSEVSETGDKITLRTVSLKTGGKDTFRLTCQAGGYTWSEEFDLEIIEAGMVPDSITLHSTRVYAGVNEAIEIDFTPVCYPTGSNMPVDDDMWDMYAGVGAAYYEARDHARYEENGDVITIAFKKPGTYLHTRQFFLDNLHYVQVCEIVAGEAQQQFDFLKAEREITSVYAGGKSGDITEICIADSLLYDVFEEQISWKLTRVSGNSLTAALKEMDDGVMLYAADVQSTGTDIWRVTCSFGDYVDSVDITVEVKEARLLIPERIHLAKNSVSGMIGSWISMPIGAICAPSGSALPETGDDFWTFEPIGQAVDTCIWKIEDGLLKMRFSYPGYYTGTLKYTAGNVKYSDAVTVSVTDEEGVLETPEMSMYLVNMADKVYTSGSVNVPVGTAAVSHGTGTYYAGMGAAYMAEHPGEWNVKITAGDAASIGIRPVSANTADVILYAMRHTGTIEFDVECKVGDMVYRRSGSLSVSDEAAPVLVLQQSDYSIYAGETLRISKAVKERRSGEFLSGSATWNAQPLLSAIGYEYTTDDEAWTATFYKKGNYTTTITASVSNVVSELPITIKVYDNETPHVFDSTLKLPAALTEVCASAYENTAVQAVDLRGTNITRICSYAFRNCKGLTVVYIPATVTMIDKDAFAGSPNVTIVCPAGSAAADFAKAYGYPYQTNREGEK